MVVHRYVVKVIDMSGKWLKNVKLEVIDPTKVIDPGAMVAKLLHLGDRASLYNFEVESYVVKHYK